MILLLNPVDGVKKKANQLGRKEYTDTKKKSRKQTNGFRSKLNGS